MTNPFTGSYSTDDVQFLLRPMAMPDTPVHIKETLIQSGQKHYSQMLTHESVPSENYLQLFYQAMALNQQRMAEHLLVLAKRILDTRPDGVTLVSLARAGTPVGVLLKHVLKRHFNTEAKHYSISILRDVGIDQNALRHILRNHAPESLVFVDGWTGKGVIAQQLNTSLQAFAVTDGVTIPAELYVLADLSGSAAVAACSEDYLIPSCILNATVSGLVSRSVYDPQLAAPTDFHGCVYYRQFEQHDLSRYFIDTMLACVEHAWQECQGGFESCSHDRLQLQGISQALLNWVSERYCIGQHNYIKPGIGEATRVLLRREAQILLLQDLDCEATQHLRWLAESRSIPIDVVTDLPYRAVALIKRLHGRRR
ncbi:cysteine protease StiP family protein [Methylobacter sp.]|uniref:cysteine protease StiP family protein n=1 Tax=Methylobacter sp. TaxID=2051955 RepID=UPI002FDE14D8